MFNIVMEVVASSMASGDASPMRLAVQMIPTPSFLVNRRQSPGWPWLLGYICLGWMVPVTDRPYLTVSSAMECPPARVPPASMTFSLPPRMISPSMFRSMFSGKQTIFSAVFTWPPMA